MNLKSSHFSKVILFQVVIVILFFTAIRVYDPFASIVWKVNKDPIALIELKGDPYQRGFTHGEQLKDEIEEVLSKWKANIREVTGEDADDVLQDFLSTSDFESAAKKYTPGILDEVRGISDGSGQPYDDIFAFQLLDELWVYIDRIFNIPNHHCSVIGVPAADGRPAYLAQNMDLEKYMNGYQVLLHIAATDDEPEQYILSCAGMVALNGLNSRGIGICMNTLMELQASSDGLPVAFLIRGVLMQQNSEDALSFFKSVRHASGLSYLISSADRIYGFEASANQIVPFRPDAKSSIFLHTNHPLVNKDRKDWYKEHEKQVMIGLPNSEARLATLRKYMNSQPENISADMIKETLSSKDDRKNPVCRPYNRRKGNFTFSSVVFTLGAKPSVQITQGPPDRFEFKEFFFAQ